MFKYTAHMQAQTAHICFLYISWSKALAVVLLSYSLIQALSCVSHVEKISIQLWDVVITAMHVDRYNIIAAFITLLCKTLNVQWANLMQFYVGFVWFLHII